MGDWSDYFEDFPEENPANWVGGRFDPRGAAAIIAQETKVAQETDKLKQTIAQMIADGNAKAKAREQSKKNETK